MSAMLSNNLILCCPLSFCLQSFPASESFPISWLSTSCGQSIGTPETILSMNIQISFMIDCFDLLLPKGLSGVFSNATVCKHQFFYSQTSWSTSHTLTLVQFNSVSQSCLTLCDPMNRSTPGLPVHHQLPQFTQTHVH